MNDQDGPIVAANPRAPRRRRVLSGIALVLACISILVTTVAVWTHQVALNTDRFTALVESVMTDPAVTDPISARISTQVVDASDVQGRLEARLPDALQPLAGTLTIAIRDAIDQRLRVALQDPRLQAALVGTVSFTHEQVVRLLRGESDVVTLVDGYLTLDVFPVVGAALAELQSMGLIPADVQLPDLTAPEAPEAAGPAPRDGARCHAAAGIRDDPADASRTVDRCSVGRSRLRPGRDPARDPDRRSSSLSRCGSHGIDVGCSSTSASARSSPSSSPGWPSAQRENVIVGGIADAGVAGAARTMVDATLARPSRPDADHPHRDGDRGDRGLSVGPAEVGRGDGLVRRRRGRACRVGGQCER